MPQAWHPGQLLFAGFEGTELPADPAELVAQGRIGGVVLFSRNVRDPKQLRRLTDSLHECARVVDVDTNPSNPVIGDRSFASTPGAVARHGVALIEGLQAEGGLEAENSQNRWP